MIRPGFIVALVLTGAVALPVVLISESSSAKPGAPTSSSNGQGPKEGPDGATCDVSGVHTSYDAAYASDAQGVYRISNVAVANIDVSCAGAELRVALVNGAGEEIGVGTDTVGFSQKTVDVAMNEDGLAVAAKDVQGVRVQIAGGTTPVPGECGSFAPDRRKFGTLGDDMHLNGTSLSDLIYGLTGRDTIRGGPNADCIDGGEHDDRIFGDEGDDVLLGQEGIDNVDGGSGRDRIFGGMGDDVLRGGVGNDHLDGGDGLLDECIGGVGADTFSDTCEAITQ